MKYAYYPGCSLHSTGKEYDHSMRAVFDALDIELEEVKKWFCCGSTAAHNTSRLLATSLPMANLALLEKMGLAEVVVPCPECFSKFKTAQHTVGNDSEIRHQVEEAIEAECNPKVKVYHPLEVLASEPMLSKIESTVEKDLSGLKVVCYYGCLITRPPKVVQFDVCEYPQSMDRVLDAVGVTTLDWNYKTDCCGASFAMTKPDIVVDLCHKIIEGAKAVGADAIAVACPICHTNLDSRQVDIAKAYDTDYDMPIFYFTQLMGHAFGIDSKKLLIGKHLVNAEKVLQEVGQHAG
jgi:heterodisulfide reductase subunit B